MAALTTTYDDALVFASTVHREDRRKGSDVPYLTHLLSVSALVLEDGGSEDEAIAALLHDAVEDHGEELVPEIRKRFGPRVTEIVLACSDSVLPAGAQKAPWRARKDAYLAHLKASADLGYLRVTLADKLHNARSILTDLRVVGPALWDRFTTKRPEDQLWYYRTLIAAFRAHEVDGLHSPMVDELARVIAQIEELTTA